MLQKVYINYSDNGALADAFSVKLGDESHAFGIKRYDNGVVLLPYGTDVDHPSTGIYEKEFDAEAGVVYVVSWEVLSTSTSLPVYKGEQIGPFFDSSVVRVVPEFKGSFVQGTVGELGVKLMAFDGSPIDAEDILVTVRNATTQEQVLSETPAKIKSGLYIYDWQILSTQTPGIYDVYWTYKVEGDVRTEPQQVIVAAHGTGTADLGTRFISLRMALENLIPELQAISIYHQQSEPSKDNRTYRFAFKSWNQSAGANIYRNDALLTGGYEIDYMKGAVTFDVPNLPEDVVYADYNFRFFDDESLLLFLSNGLNDYNTYAPHTNYSLSSIPDHYVTATIYGAVVNAIRAYQQKVMWPKYRKLYESRELADRVYEQLESQKKDYSEKVEKLSDQKKLFPYRGLTKLIIQPMYTLPGGRARFFRYLFGGESS